MASDDAFIQTGIRAPTSIELMLTHSGDLDFPHIILYAWD